MAISRERLEELIKEGATIYDKNSYSIDLSKTDSFMENIFEFYYMIEDNRLLKIQKQPHIALNQWWIKDLYETRKQAEWYSTYHVTRTEELNLPMWEEVKNIKNKDVVSFYAKNRRFGVVCIHIFTKYFNVESEDEVFLYTEFTEENYIKACDLCVKLFKGE